MVVYIIDQLDYDIESGKYTDVIALEFGVFKNREDALTLCKQKAEQLRNDLRQMGYGNMSITKQDDGYTILDEQGRFLDSFTIRYVPFY